MSYSQTGYAGKNVLAPLLRACRHVGARHVSLFGSSVWRPLREVGDVDVHVVVQRMGRKVHHELVEAGREAASRLANCVGARPALELRHGPFKPAPGNGRVMQLHLVVDDTASLSKTPYIVLAHRAFGGSLLLGEPLARLRADRARRRTPAREASVDLGRWRDALSADQLVFRQWAFTPRPRLVEASTPVDTAWDRTCLLSAVVRAFEFHYTALARHSRDGADIVDPITRLLQTQLSYLSAPAGEHEWRALRSLAIRLIEEHLKKLDAAG